MWKQVARYAGYGFAAIGVMILVLFGLSMSKDAMEDSEFAQATGLSSVSSRAYAVKEAIRWEVASWPFFRDYDILEPDYRLYGNLYSLSRDGTLIFRYFDPETKELRYARAELANVEVQKLMPTAQRVQKMSYSNAVIEVYNDRYIIIWIDREAFNRDLVKEGLAIPKEGLNTPIKGRIISDYYWRQAK